MHSSRRSRSRSPHRDDRGRDRSRSRERDRERADRRDRDRERDRDRDRAPRDSDRARDGHQGDRGPESKEQKKEKALDALVLAPSSKRPIDLSQPFDIPPWAIQPELKHAVLAVFKDAEAVQAVQLGAKAVITFGRNKEQCDEALSHGSISRQHAAIIHALDGINVVDLKSSHGTTVNGEKLAPGVPRVLKDGDTIVFGASSRKYVVRLNVNEEDANKLVLPTGVDKAAVDKKRAEKRAREKEEHEKRASSKHDKSKAQESDSKNKRHKDQGQKGETVSARHLLLKHVNSRKPQAKGVPITRTEEEAIRLIQEYRRQIVQTAEDTKRPLLDVFGEYATQYSDCSSSTRGGDLGEFGRGKMNPPFEAASFALPVGGLSEVVMTSSGAHIILRTG